MLHSSLYNRPVTTFIILTPGLALLAAAAWAYRDAQKGDTAKVLWKLIVTLGLLILITGLVTAWTLPPPSPYGGPPSAPPYGAPPG